MVFSRSNVMTSVFSLTSWVAFFDFGISLQLVFGAGFFELSSGDVIIAAIDVYVKDITPLACVFLGWLERQIELKIKYVPVDPL